MAVMDGSPLMIVRDPDASTCTTSPSDVEAITPRAPKAGHIAMIEEIAFAIDCESALWGRNLRFPTDRFDDCLCIVPSHMERFRATSED